MTKMALEETKFNNYMSSMFTRYGADYYLICDEWNKLHLDSTNRIRDRLRTYGHFYYFICLPEETDIREEMRLIGITSLIEAMMGDVEYKDIFSYFKSEFPNKNSIDDFKKLKGDYLEKYGATRRIVKYFELYISKDTITPILSKIRVWNKEMSELESVGSISTFAKFLYQMRSDFVHKADMQSFCDPKHFAALVSVGGNAYDIRFNVKEVMKMFEESFVIYWVNKVDILQQNKN